MQMKWSLYLGKVSGIRLSVHWTFVILVGWIFLVYYQMQQDIPQAFRGVLFILALFVCVTLHELGHALTAKRFNIITKSITLLPIGGLAQMEKLPEKPGQELWVAIAGPLVNVAIAMLLFLFLFIVNKSPLLDLTEMQNLTGYGFWSNLLLANIVLAIFNLMPAFPMDGGRVLRALLSFRFDRAKATRIAAGIGQVLAIFFVFFGFFANIWLIFIGVFIYLGAGAEANFETTKTALHGYTVRDVLMKRYSCLSPEEPLANAIKFLLDGQDTEFIVTQGETVVGILTRKELIMGLSEKGKSSTISNAMRKDFLTLSPDMLLTEVFPKLMSSDSSVAPVLENEKLIGIVDKENISELIMVNQAIANASQTSG